jgi:bacteriorhodopsin
MKSTPLVRNYYVLPCCLLLLNLCIELVSYKAKMVADVLLRTTVIMGMVLFGGSLVAFLIAPAIGVLVASLHRSSRQRGGTFGELFFLLLLGLIVFWLYYRIYIIGPESVLPAGWRNPPLRIR